MNSLTAWSERLLVNRRKWRVLFFVATSSVACVYYYVLLKLTGGDSLHRLARLYAANDEATLRQLGKLVPLSLADWRAASFNWRQALELGLDTGLIPLYSLTLLLYWDLYSPYWPTGKAPEWLKEAASRFISWLPVLILLSAAADLIENSLLTYLAIRHDMPVSTTVMLAIRVVKLNSFYVVAGYIVVRFLLSTPVLLFLEEMLRNLWSIFKVLTLNKYIRCGVAMLRTVWPICLVLTITYLFLNVMDQARDLLYALVNDLIYSICVFACLLLYAVVTWYSARIIFILKDQRHLVEQVSDMDEDQEQLTRLVALHQESNDWLARWPAHRRIDSMTLRAFTRWTPVVLGLVPFFLFGAALSQIEETTRHQLALVGLTLIFLGIAYRTNNYVDGRGADDCNIRSNLVKNLLPIHQRRLWMALAGGVLLVVLASNGTTNLLLSRFLGPVAIVFLALTMWVMIASFFTYLDYRFKAPFTLICLLIMMFMDNNNHQIRTVSRTKSSYFSKDPATHAIPVYFKAWLNQLLADRAKTPYPNEPIPVYLISTEGGGIRSAYWTATALKQLDSAQSDFFRHVFAISGVSGGSVGAAIFTAQYRDRLVAEQAADSVRFTFNLDQFFARDYLSPLLTAMLIPDMLQKFSPVSMNGVDRAQYLEDGWADAYYDAQHIHLPVSQTATIRPSRTLDSSFVSLWADPATRYRIPVLFLNATQAETGRKGIMTPLVIQRDPHFSNVVDIQEEVYRHIPLKTAASISARFPLVTPPATIRVVNEPAVDASNFVDGGYLDNSGTTTLLSILSSISSDPDLLDLLTTHKVVFRLISMNNSVETNPEQPIKSISGLYEFKAPLLAFLGSWDNSGNYRRYAVKEYARGFSSYGRYDHNGRLVDTTRARGGFISDQQLYSINLNRRVGVIPLGWDLSEQAEARIQEQGRQLYQAFRQPGPYEHLLTGLSTRHSATQRTSALADAGLLRRK